MTIHLRIVLGFFGVGGFFLLLGFIVGMLTMLVCPVPSRRTLATVEWGEAAMDFGMILGAIGGAFALLFKTMGRL